MTKTYTSETRERRLFRSLVERPDGEIDLARAALAIAGEEYPDLEFDRYLNQLDRWAEAVQGVLPGDSLGTLAALIDRLSRVEGFRGVPGAFQDPRASFLSDVLERRTGIPISLALVYMLVGERAGLTMTGVAFPGHFLARCDLRGGFVLLDAFSGGRQLSLGDCELLLQEVHRGALFDPSLVEPAANRAVLFRMLSNLKMLYLKATDWKRALSALDRMLVLVPDHPSVLRDRGLLYFHLEQSVPALRDLERYQELAPERAGSDPATLAVCDLARRRFQALN